MGSTMATQGSLCPTQQNRIKIERPKAEAHGVRASARKRKIPGSTEVSKKGKSASKAKESRPGTVRRGRRPQVGFMPKAEFQRRFRRTITGAPSKPLKIPKAFCQYITGDFPQKLVLANVVGDTWRVVLAKWQERIFIDHGWDEFAEANMIEKGDTLIFTYTIGSSLKVDIFGSNGCEKIPERN